MKPILVRVGAITEAQLKERASSQPGRWRMATLWNTRSVAMMALLVTIAGASLTGCGGGAGSAGGGGAAGSQLPISTSVPGIFISVGSMTTARAGHTATLLHTGKVLIAGGVDGVQQLASAELYDPATSEFTFVGNMTTSRSGHTATLLADGKVLIAARRELSFGGGAGAGGHSAEIYDPSTGTFTATGNMTSAGGPATLLPDGRVLVAGDSAELYDPARGAFTLTGGYAHPAASWDTATLLQDGRVLLAGSVGVPPVGATELFDSRSGTFSLTGPMQTWSDSVSAAKLLMDGTVLVLEPTLDVPTDGADIYDPTTGTFSAIGRTKGYHAFCASVRLPDGTVLITGGQQVGGNGGSATEVYLPANRIFASGGNMITARDFHTATLLPDGTVLIAGGLSIWAPTKLTSNAEIYMRCPCV